MKTSDNGINVIMSNEGWLSKPYPDPPGSGLFSIGYGHQIQPGEIFTKITKDEAKVLLSADLSKTELAVNKAVKVPLTQAQFDSLVDFTYNTGKLGGPCLDRIAGILNSNVENNYKLAGLKMKEFNKSLDLHGKLVVNPVLVARREQESKAFAV